MAALTLETQMKFKTTFIIILLVSWLLAACSTMRPERDSLADQIDVFGVRFSSTIDYQEINGVKAVEEPCLKGYERIFDALDIIVGYNFDGRVRKITTRNPRTSMFGIKPGMTFGEGKEKILKSGFVEYTPLFKFRFNGLFLTLLVDDKDRIFGLKLESQD